jgi:hypothetical protein
LPAQNHPADAELGTSKKFTVHLMQKCNPYRRPTSNNWTNGFLEVKTKASFWLAGFFAGQLVGKAKLP